MYLFQNSNSLYFKNYFEIRKQLILRKIQKNSSSLNKTFQTLILFSSKNCKLNISISIKKFQAIFRCRNFRTNKNENCIFYTGISDATKPIKINEGISYDLTLFEKNVV